MTIIFILSALVFASLFIGVRLLNELNSKDKQPERPSGVFNTIGKSGSLFDVPGDAKDVSLSPRPNVDGQQQHSLVGAHFSGGLDVVMEEQLAFDLKLKYDKIELMLTEKNKEIESLKKDLEVEQSMHKEFETLRRAFTEQLEELKEQNRKSKEDLHVILRENIELKNALQQMPAPVIEDYIRAEVDTRPDIVLTEPKKEKVLLKDIFSQNNVKEEGEV